MDETALIADAKNGNVQAYNSLVIHYQELAYNVARRIVGSPQAAEDITQESFIAAYKALNRFRDGSFKSWLLRIVTNRCYDELRRHKRRPQFSIDELTEDNESAPFLRSLGETPEQAQQRAELAEAIERCLQGLPDDQRTATVLCDVEGYEYNEIADILSISLGTVKSRISRARSKLRDCLQKVQELLPLQYRLST